MLFQFQRILINLISRDGCKAIYYFYSLKFGLFVIFFGAFVNQIVFLSFFETFKSLLLLLLL